MTTTLKTPPQTEFPELLKTTWSIFRSSFGLITLFLIVFEMPSIIIGTLGGYLYPAETEMMDTKVFQTTLLTGLISVPFALLSMLSMIILADRHRSGAGVDYQTVLALAFHSFGRGLSAFLFTFLMLLLWTLLLIIPGIIFGVRYVFAVQAAVLRDQRAKPSIDYSSGVVSGRWWLVALTIFGLYIPNIVLSLFFPSLMSDSLAFIFLSAVITGYPAMFAMIGSTVLFLELDRSQG